MPTATGTERLLTGCLKDCLNPIALKVRQFSVKDLPDGPVRCAVSVSGMAATSSGSMSLDRNLTDAKTLMSRATEATVTSFKVIIRSPTTAQVIV